MKIAVIQFPGSNCDYDVLYVLRNVLKAQADLLWHKSASLNDYSAIVLPGGFSYGDHLRAGAIAAFSPAMKEIRKAAKEGKPVLGICNGFQILVEAGLLPGALLRNAALNFICKWISIRAEVSKSPFTTVVEKGTILRMPIAHNEGRYFVDEENLRELERGNQILFRYCEDSGLITPDSNPNGSIGNIAGVSNGEGNVAGLMPHPERASEKILSKWASKDGLAIFTSVLKSL